MKALRIICLFLALIVLSAILGVMLWEKTGLRTSFMSSSDPVATADANQVEGEAQEPEEQLPTTVETPIGVLPRCLAEEGQQLIERWRPFLVETPGPAPTAAQTKTQSHFNDPIVNQTVTWRGCEVTLTANSRRIGDADVWVQMVCIDLLCERLRGETFGLSEANAAWLEEYAIACFWKESWLNPFAAAGQSSASGSYQFINKTRSSLASRCSEETRTQLAADLFDVHANNELFMAQLEELITFVTRRIGSNADRITFFRTVYGFHHDWTKYDDTAGTPTRLKADEVVNRMELIHRSL